MFEPHVWSAHGVGIAAGGLVAVKLSGHGALAMATHGQPLTLECRPAIRSAPIRTRRWPGPAS